MSNYSRKEVVMENLSNYVKKNLKMSLSNFIWLFKRYGLCSFLSRRFSLEKEEREITILYLRVLRGTLFYLQR